MIKYSLILFLLIFLSGCSFLANIGTYDTDNPVLSCSECGYEEICCY